MDGFIFIFLGIALLFALIYFPWIKPLKDKGYTWKKFVEDEAEEHRIRQDRIDYIKRNDHSEPLLFTILKIIGVILGGGLIFMGIA